MSASEYWDYQLIQNYIYPRATFGEEPWASKLKAAPDELIPMFRREAIHVVVVGGETNGYWRIMGCNCQKTVRSSGASDRIAPGSSYREFFSLGSRLRIRASDRKRA